MYKRALAARKRANAIDKVKLAIEAHNRKIQMTNLLEQAQVKKLEAEALRTKQKLAADLREKQI
jgi:hypothetical protein